MKPRRNLVLLAEAKECQDSMPSTWRLDVLYGRTVAKGADVENTGIKNTHSATLFRREWPACPATDRGPLLRGVPGGLFAGELRKMGDRKR